MTWQSTRRSPELGGWRYEGEWFDDLPEGHGVLYYDEDGGKVAVAGQPYSGWAIDVHPHWRPSVQTRKRGCGAGLVAFGVLSSSCAV